MMKIYKTLLLGLGVCALAACEKDEPMAELGKTSGLYSPEVQMTASNRAPETGDTVAFTVTTWQRNDDIAKVELLHKLYEDFGLYFELDKTVVETWDPDAPLMVVSDTIANNVTWKTFPEDGMSLNDYYVTSNNAYVLRGEYKQFKPESGKYSLEGEELLDQLPDEPYQILLNQLSYAITVAEYEKLFPEADDTKYKMTGGARTGISSAGQAYLRNNLTKELLKEKGFKELKKVGNIHTVVTARITTSSGVVAERTNEFKSTY
ncbi:hypothetical protein ACSX1A_02695 [Pontibacter sp. MBLB2868]|uniref:hypothetical protein n=1 Tax=Pontibacter sp. MBLB2868 TaxID=3451555 RepID=UPI003F7540D5